MIKKMMLMLFVMALTSGQLEAAEYFVGKQGADTNDGLAKKRGFLTIQKGVDTLNPGDTLTIGPGEYPESVRRAKLGSAEKETLIRAEIPGTVLLRGDILVPPFKKVEGARFVYVADIAVKVEVVVVNELDTLKIYERMPNVTELEFSPGSFHHDLAAGKLYISTSDMSPADIHRYTASIIPTHGVYLASPRRVAIEGLSVTGFNAMQELNYRECTAGGVWGMFLVNGKDCVIRDCRAYMNGWGIGLTSAEAGSGDNVIERCTSWANTSQFWAGDMGGLTIFTGRRDTIRDSTSFMNGKYGINIYGTGTDGGTYGDKNVPGNDDRNKSRLVNNLAWGNYCDFKIKTGVEYFHTTERCIGPGLWSVMASNTIHCLMGRNGKGGLADNIILTDSKCLDMSREFADPDNYDFRLQEKSCFRKTAPDGSDSGPFPYENNIFYVRTDGDDQADGLSAGNAWKTLGRAVKNLKSGDTLYLEPGVYESDLELSLKGEATKQIAIRGRGSKPVVIRGALRMKGSSQVEFERLRFSGKINIDGGFSIGFKNCHFTSAEVAMAGVKGLTFFHCSFTGLRQAALNLKDCSQVWLSGNLYDNREGAAVRLDGGTTIKYSDYNSYCPTTTAWMVDGRGIALADLQAGKGGVNGASVELHDMYSRSLIPEFAQVDGVAALKNAGVFSAGGPFRKSFGVYRDEKRQGVLELIAKPEVHSVSATTANMEWMISQPATCELAWGKSPVCENTVSFDSNRFGTYSLTGLEPGRKYYFRIKSLQKGKANSTETPVESIDLKGEAISFETLKVNPAPLVYYVAPDGNDTGTGLDRKNAWKTIQYAAGRVNVGDTVLIAGGKYKERVRIRATGETSAPITFKSIPGEKVFLDGSGKSLTSAFIAAGKNQLRFDGFYLVDFGMSDSAEFNLYSCRDISITRCFSDGRGGYTASSILARNVENLLVKNCVNINKMGSAISINRSPNARIENTVFFLPMIYGFVINNTADQKVFMENNIFTDMLEKKAKQNITFSEIEELESLRLKNNCFLFRCFPPEERKVLAFVNHATHSYTQILTMPEFEKTMPGANSIYADPGVAGDPGVKGNPADKTGFAPDRMMETSFKLDFNSFFATNPELIRRGIGLQPESFKDFSF